MIETPKLDDLANHYRIHGPKEFLSQTQNKLRESKIEQALLEVRDLLRNVRIKALP